MGLIEDFKAELRAHGATTREMQMVSAYLRCGRKNAAAAAIAVCQQRGVQLIQRVEVRVGGTINWGLLMTTGNPHRTHRHARRNRPRPNSRHCLHGGAFALSVAV
jgi:hypothetical protein